MNDYVSRALNDISRIIILVFIRIFSSVDFEWTINGTIREESILSFSKILPIIFDLIQQ